MADLDYGYGPPSPYGAPTLPAIPISKPAGGPMGFSLGSLASGALGAGIDFFSARDTNKKAKALAREQMRFQERLSNTAYQRAVKDMRAAGINPMLAYMQGGASTPGGAQPTLKSPAVGDQVSKAFDLTSQQRLRRAQYDQSIAQAGTAKAIERNTNAQATQNEVTSKWARENPEIYGPLSVGGSAGAAASGAASLGRFLKGMFK